MFKETFLPKTLTPEQLLSGLSPEQISAWAQRVRTPKVPKGGIPYEQPTLGVTEGVEFEIAD